MCAAGNWHLFAFISKCQLSKQMENVDLEWSGIVEFPSLRIIPVKGRFACSGTLDSSLRAGAFQNQHPVALGSEKTFLDSFLSGFVQFSGCFSHFWGWFQGSHISCGVTEPCPALVSR